MGTDSTIDLTSVQTGEGNRLKVTELSVCIVTYKARDWLRGCLDSLYSSTTFSPFEVIVVDNGSKDGVREMLEQEFPSVRFIENECNEGYTRPMNQSLKVATGRYLMQLNPDTVILTGSFDRLVDFMEAHPEVGICGPKVLNQDGTLQKQCRRGEPRPLAVLSYFLGLWKVFPNSKLLGGYLLDYEGEDKTLEVAAVSGSCMLIRKEVVEQIGYLDEQFYAYQEDSDYCARVRKAGWKVIYMPEAQIIHYGGQGGSRVEPYRSIVEWHRSYWLYYKKHLAKDYIFLFNWFYYLIMVIKLGIALLGNLLRKEKYAGPIR
jgi:GT2 family glycosyltransferase